MTKERDDRCERLDPATLRLWDVLDQVEALAQPWFAEIIDAVNRERYMLMQRVLRKKTSDMHNATNIMLKR